MKSIILSSIIALLFITNSCSKNNDDDSANHTELRIEKVILNDTLVTKYEYYSNGELKNKLRYQNNVISSTTNYIWENDTIVRTYSLPSGSGSQKPHKFIKLSDSVIKEIYDKNQYRLHYQNNDCYLDSLQYYSIEKDFNTSLIINRLNQVIRFKQIDNLCSHSIQLQTYHPQNSINDNGNNILDGKNMFSRNANNPIFNKFSAGNIIARTGSISFGKIYTSKFTYNEFDYPIEEVRTYDNGKVDIFNYEYY